MGSAEIMLDMLWGRWEVVEAGAGAPLLHGASLPPDQTGPQVGFLGASFSAQQPGMACYPSLACEGPRMAITWNLRSVPTCKQRVKQR